MSCADDFFKFLCKWILDNCSEDLKFVSKRIDKTCIAHLQSMISTTIEKISYADAVNSFKQVDHTSSSLGILTIIFTQSNF